MNSDPFEGIQGPVDPVSRKNGVRHVIPTTSDKGGPLTLGTSARLHNVDVAKIGRRSRQDCFHLGGYAFCIVNT